MLRKLKSVLSSEPNTTEVKAHQVQKVKTGEVDSQAFYTHECVECGERHSHLRGLLWSDHCDGEYRTGGLITEPICLVYTNKTRNKMWFKAIGTTKNGSMNIDIRSKHHDKNMIRFLENLRIDDAITARLRSNDKDARAWVIEEVVDEEGIQCPEYDVEIPIAETPSSPESEYSDY